MLLTISLLCSGRDKSTKDCLDSLKKIMEKVDSELIIVDTGCNEEMKKLLYEYTDQVIPFTWCEDFAAARNVGVDAASGQWFMTIDDDEWFVDPSLIIDFFTEGIYKNYTSASYQVRNYRNLEGTEYVDAYVRRIFKLAPDKTTRYKGCIHEYFLTIEGGEYCIPAHAEHYGYAYVDAQAQYLHARRNIPLLLKMMEEEPDNVRWPQHLSIEYNNIREYTKLAELCEDTLKRLAGRNDWSANHTRPIFYTGALTSYINLRDYSAAKKVSVIALDDKRNSQMAEARVLELSTFLLGMDDKDYNQIYQMTSRFLEIYENLRDDADAIVDQTTFFVMDAFNPINVNDMISYHIMAAIVLQKYEECQVLFNKYVWNAENTSSIMSSTVLEVLDVALEASDVESIQKLIGMYLKEQKTVDGFVDKGKKLLKTENDKKVIQLFSAIDSEHYFVKYCKLLGLIYRNELANNVDVLIDYLNSSAEFLGNDNVWEAVEKAQLDKIECLMTVKPRHFISAVDQYIKTHKKEDYEKCLTYFESAFAKEDKRFDYLQMKLYEALFVNKKADEWRDFEEMLEAISVWTQVVLNYYGDLMTDAAFEGDCIVFDDRTAVAIKLARFLIVAGEDFRAAYTELKSAMGICPQLDETLNRLAKLYGDFYKSALA